MKEFWTNLKFAWFYAKEQKKEIIKYALINILLIFISIFVPIISSKIIVSLTSNNFKQLIFMALIILILENIRNFVHYYSRYFAQVAYRETFTKIQGDLGKNILRLENNTIDKYGSGVFIQRLTNDTSRLADIFNILNYYLTRIITDIGIFFAIFLINKIAFLFVLVFTIIRYIIENKRVKKYIEQDKNFRNENDNVSSFVGEIVRGVRDIKMLNAENSFISALNNKIISLNKKRYDMQDIDRKYIFFRGAIRDLSDFLLIILLVILIKYDSLEIASALIIHNYAGRIPNIVDNIGVLLDKIKDFNLSSLRIFTIINSDEFKKEKFGNTHLDKVEGNFEFKNVTFGYNEEPVLKNLNFKVNANETVAFVGKSGAGKTTIFNLLCKMYNIEEGSIKIDGIDIQELDKDSIRNNITIISQNPYIFNVSIRENFKLVKEDLTEDEMIKACKIACLDEFIMSLPNKYDTIIGEGGINLSGGQKQRLAIARALVQKTEIILFDEATSALDNETQTSIQKAIDNMKNEYTILIIAHRLSTIINSDRILFLDNGKIEAEGTHKELLKKSKKYKQLYDAEINKD